MTQIAIQIKDKVNGILSFDLYDILLAINEYGANYEWEVVFIEPVIIYPDRVDVENHIHYQSDFSNSNMQWKQLVELSRIFEQICNCEVIGKSNNDTITIEGVDTSFWEIKTGSEEIIAALKSAFNNTTSVL
ncbi:MAG: hypothetical protein KA149_10865 [Chitinophagales bacterium]|nr:hypothetical protein [Chitinophagales bacterium]